MTSVVSRTIATGLAIATPPSARLRFRGGAAKHPRLPCRRASSAADSFPLPPFGRELGPRAVSRRPVTRPSPRRHRLHNRSAGGDPRRGFRLPAFDSSTPCGDALRDGWVTSERDDVCSGCIGARGTMAKAADGTRLRVGHPAVSRSSAIRASGAVPPLL
jgi:hypothetical protein